MMLERIGITKPGRLITKENKQQIAELRKDLPTMLTDELSNGYHVLKEFENELAKITKDIRKELVEERLGDFHTDGEDEILKRYTPFGCLEITTKKTEKRDPLKLQMLLESKGLLDRVQTRTTKIDNPEVLLSVVFEMMEKMESEGMDTRHHRETVENSIVHSVKIEESKVDALVELGFIEESELQEISTVSESHTLRMK